MFFTKKTPQKRDKKNTFFLVLLFFVLFDVLHTMNWPYDSKSWLEYPAECLWYLMPGIVYHIIALILSLIAVAMIQFFKFCKPRITTVLIFQGYLLIIAMLVNGIWSCSIWGKLYWSVDYTADFSAFFPITPRKIVYSWGPELSGGLNKISLTVLNLIWAFFAVITWGLAFIATRWTTQLSRKDHNK